MVILKNMKWEFFICTRLKYKHFDKKLHWNSLFNKRCKNQNTMYSWYIWRKHSFYLYLLRISWSTDINQVVFIQVKSQDSRCSDKVRGKCFCVQLTFDLLAHRTACNCQVNQCSSGFSVLSDFQHGPLCTCWRETKEHLVMTRSHAFWYVVWHESN